MSKKITVIDFFAEWCGPCKMLTPIIDQLIEEYKDNEFIEIKKVDVDKDNDIANQYNVRNIPNIVFINENDEVVDRQVGATNKQNLKNKIENLLNT